MLNPIISQILATRFPSDLVTAATKAFEDVQANYRIEKWKTSELDAGHFVEAIRRILEHELTGSYTPVTKSLGSFSPAVLSKYESSQGDEAFRILIPRVLFSVYCIRNKRGVGHLAALSPNKLDATYILNSCKWVLAELVRISSGSDPKLAHEITESIMERQLDIVWDDGESFMYLSGNLNTDNKILIALYKQDRRTIKELQELTKYKNKTNFRKIIEKLRKCNYIDVISGDICKISPLGVSQVEAVINGV